MTQCCNGVRAATLTYWGRLSVKGAMDVVVVGGKAQQTGMAESVATKQEPRHFVSSEAEPVFTHTALQLYTHQQIM